MADAHSRQIHQLSIHQLSISIYGQAQNQGNMALIRKVVVHTVYPLATPTTLTIVGSFSRGSVTAVPDTRLKRD